MIYSRITWVICTLGFAAMLIPISIGFKRDYKIYTEGKLVKVIVTGIPHNWTTRSKGMMFFNYDGEGYKILVSGQVDNIFHTGDTIQLRYLKGYEYHFMLPNSNPIPWGITDILLMALGIIVGIYYLINLPKK